MFFEMGKRALVRTVSWGLGAVGAVYAASTLLAWRAGWARWLQELAPLVAPLAAGGACLRARRRASGRAAGAWLLFGAGAVSWGLGEAVFTSLELAGRDPVKPATVADVGYLALIPLWGAALVLLQPGGRRRGLARLGAAIDALTVLVAAGSATAAFVLVPLSRTAEDLPGAAVKLAYPVGDLALLAALVTLLMRSPRRLPPAELRLAAVVALFAVGDITYAAQAIAGTDHAGSPVDLTWVGAFVLLGSATRLPLSSVEEEEAAAMAPLPFAALLGLASTAALAVAALFSERGILLPGAVAAGLLFLVRRLVLLAENRELVDTLARTVRELEGALQANDAFVAAASHQLRTPLSSLQLRIDLLSALEPGDPRRGEYLREMAGEVARLQRLTSSLLSLLASGSPPVPEPLEAGPALRAVADRVRPLAEARGIVLGVAEVPAGLRVSSPPGAFEEVVLNLVDNAVKHAPRHGEVTIGVKEQGDRVEVRVTDDGPGILPRPAGPATGYGLGLAIARRLCEASGATLQVGPAPGRGCLARVLWPLHRGEPEEEEAREDRADADFGRRRRVPHRQGAA